MTEEKLYSDVRFVKIENLKGRAKTVADEQGLTEGLAILKIIIGSRPEYEIKPVSGDSFEALKQLALEDGISEDKLSKAFEDAFK